MYTCNYVVVCHYLIVHYGMGVGDPSLVPRPEKRAWYTLSAHAPKCTQNPGTSYISIKQSVNYLT